MGCGGIDADVQTDYQIQGAWLQGDYTLYINAASMVVKYFTDVSTPYRTEFSYGAGGAAANPILGSFTLFDYKSNDEIASFNVSCVPGETLTISDISWNVEEYYYANAFPIKGAYVNVAEALVQAGYDPIDATWFEFNGVDAEGGGVIVLTGTKAVVGATAAVPNAKNIEPVEVDGVTCEGEITVTGFKIGDDKYATFALAVAALVADTETEIFIVFDVASDKKNGLKAATGLELLVGEYKTSD
jgi:hypothetical protein